MIILKVNPGVKKKKNFAPIYTYKYALKND